MDLNWFDYCDLEIIWKTILHFFHFIHFKIIKNKISNSYEINFLLGYIFSEILL